jgi:hypothetical protein
MRLISHRGNLTGRIPDRENTKLYIIEALSQGYDVEVDVWYVGGELYLGHNSIQEEVDITFLQNDKLWVHCKSIKALEMCLENNIHCFFHNEDDCVLTSKGYIWVYPGNNLGKIRDKSIAVLPEYIDGEYDCYGVCSDYITLYKHITE